MRQTDRPCDVPVLCACVMCLCLAVWGSQIESWIAFVQVQSFIVSFPDIPWDSLPLYKDIRSALVPVMENLDYLLPDVQCICFWGYVKSGALILTPIVAWRIFKLAVDWQRWEHDIVHNLGPAMLRKLAHWAAACVLAVVVALAVDCIDCSSRNAIESREDIAHANSTTRASWPHHHKLPSHHLAAARRSSNASAAASAHQAPAPEGMCSEFRGAGQCKAWRQLVALEGLPRPTMGWLVALVSLNTLVLVIWLAVALLARHKVSCGERELVEESFEEREGAEEGFQERVLVIWLAVTLLARRKASRHRCRHRCLLIGGSCAPADGAVVCLDEA